MPGVRLMVERGQTFVMTFLFRSPILLNLPCEAKGVRIRLVKERRQRCPSKGSGVFATAKTETVDIQRDIYNIYIDHK